MSELYSSKKVWGGAFLNKPVCAVYDTLSKNEHVHPKIWVLDENKIVSYIYNFGTKQSPTKQIQHHQSLMFDRIIYDKFEDNAFKDLQMFYPNFPNQRIGNISFSETSVATFNKNDRKLVFFNYKTCTPYDDKGTGKGNIFSINFDNFNGMTSENLQKFKNSKIEHFLFQDTKVYFSDSKIDCKKDCETSGSVWMFDLATNKFLGLIVNDFGKGYGGLTNYFTPSCFTQTPEQTGWLIIIKKPNNKNNWISHYNNEGELSNVNILCQQLGEDFKFTDSRKMSKKTKFHNVFCNRKSEQLLLCSVCSSRNRVFVLERV